MGVQTSNMNRVVEKKPVKIVKQPKLGKQSKLDKQSKLNKQPGTTSLQESISNSNIKNMNILDMLKRMRVEMQQALALYNSKFLSEDFCDKISIVFNHKLQELKVDDARLLAQYINSDVSNTKFNMYYKFEPNKEQE